jgi:hypothetical protein
LKRFILPLIFLASAASAQVIPPNYAFSTGGTGGSSSPTTPGGSNGQLQYNNSGSFGGVSGSGITATGVSQTSISATALQVGAYSLAPTPATFTATDNSAATGVLIATGTAPRAYIYPISPNGAAVKLGQAGASQFQIQNSAGTALVAAGGVSASVGIGTATLSGIQLEVGGGITAPNISASSVVLRPGTSGAAPYSCVSPTTAGAMALSSSSIPNYCNGKTNTWQNASGGAAVW